MERALSAIKEHEMTPYEFQQLKKAKEAEAKRIEEEAKRNTLANK